MYSMERIKKKQMKALKCTEKVLRNNMMKFKPLFFTWIYEFSKVWMYEVLIENEQIF